MEKWIEIYNAKGYFISTTGRIFSYRTNKFLKTAYDKNGYEIISLQTKKGRRTFKVHRLVLTHFGPLIIYGKKTVNHIDGDKTNNNIENLEWLSDSEQQKHAIKLGLKTIKYGKDSPNNVYSEKTIHTICQLISENKRPKEIADILGVPNDKKLHSLLYRIRSKRHWVTISNKYF